MALPLRSLHEGVAEHVTWRHNGDICEVSFIVSHIAVITTVTEQLIVLSDLKVHLAMNDCNDVR
jgi:hypothetical protein